MTGIALHELDVSLAVIEREEEAAAAGHELHLPTVDTLRREGTVAVPAPIIVLAGERERVVSKKTATWLAMIIMHGFRDW